MKLIACEVMCGSGFCSNDKFCIKCEYFSEGLDKYGKTKTNMDYQVDALVKSVMIISKQIKD